MSCWDNKLTVGMVLDAMIVVATLGVLLAFFILAWRNRAHEQIKARFWASIWVGLMGTLIAGRFLVTVDSPTEALFEQYLPGASLFLTAALAWLLVTLKQERKETDFVTVFLINLKTSRALDVEDQSYYGGRNSWHDAYIVERLRKDQEEAAKLQTADAKGLARTTDLYHGVLLRCILDQLFERYHSHWDLRVSQFQLPYGTRTHYGPREGALGMQNIQWSDVEKLFPDCLALGQAKQHLDSMAVPLGTKLNGKSEKCESETLSYQLSFTHPFFSIVLTIGYGGGVQRLRPLC